MVELAEAQRSLAQKDEELRQLVERMQRLEANQEIMARERRQEPRRHTRYHMHYGIDEEDEDWRVHHAHNRCHQHHQ